MSNKPKGMGITITCLCLQIQNVSCLFVFVFVFVFVFGQVVVKLVAQQTKLRRSFANGRLQGSFCYTLVSILKWLGWWVTWARMVHSGLSSKNDNFPWASPIPRKDPATPSRGRLQRIGKLFTQIGCGSNLQLKSLSNYLGTDRASTLTNTC